ncbi:MAG: hypothetical protein ABIS31_01330 [Candidatus Eisenbacteria bacterium]
MSMTQRIVSWIALVAVLVATPAAVSGRFECSLGMAEAGPACSLCHGDSAAPPEGPSIGFQCCKYVSAEAAPAGIAAFTHESKRWPVLIPVFNAALSEFGSASNRPRLPIGPILASALRPRPPQSHLGNFLRL